MKNRRQDSGKRTEDLNNRRKVLCIVLLAFLFLTISASVAEAAAMDRVKKAWGQVRHYALAPAFWINALIIFGVLFILYSLLLAQKMGSDNSQKVMMYILIGIIALIIATKILAANGTPQYMWKNEQFGKFTQFMIGPTNPKGSCGGGVPSQLKAILNWDPNPPCCGTGAYDALEKGRPVCRQALLRTNENGSGLPALIVAFLAFFLLFKVFGEKLGFSDTGSGGGKWLPIILAGVLAALITNQRVTKNTIIMIAGWVAVILIGVKLSKKWSEGDQEQGHAKKLFAFALAVAAVELACNLLGGSLFGGDVTASDISFGRIIWVMIIGIPFGFIYTTLTTDGLFGRIMNRINGRRRQEVGEWINRDQYGRAIGRNAPGGGFFDALHPAQQQQTANQAIETTNNELIRTWQAYREASARQPQNPLEMQQLMLHIQQLDQRLRQIIDTGNVPPAQIPPAQPAPPAAPPDRGPPEMPNI